MKIRAELFRSSQPSPVRTKSIAPMKQWKNSGELGSETVPGRGHVGCLGLKAFRPQVPGTDWAIGGCVPQVPQEGIFTV